MRLLTLVLLGLALAGADAHADSVLRWKHDIQPDKKKVNAAGRMSVSTPRGRQVYWYLVYTVRNTHDEAVPLSLHARAETDASNLVFNEGYYPHALKRIRQKFGEDVKDSLSLKGYELQPDETVRAVAIFQFRKPDSEGGMSREFEENVDRFKIKFDGYCDPVKKKGLEFTKEHVQLWMHFEKKGDQYDPAREPVKYLSSEEKVVE